MGGKKLINHYATLGIARDATLDQIKTAYRKLQTLYHPDKNSGAPEHLIKLAEEKLKEINAAKEVLLDPEKRAEFDRSLHASEQGSAPAKPAFVPESIDFGRIKAGETYRAHFDIQNVGGPPINPPDLDMSPDSDWLDVAQVAPSDPDRFWFGLEVTVTNLSDSANTASPRDAWISITVDGAKARARVTGFFDPSLTGRKFSIDVLVGELIDSSAFYADLSGEVLHCGYDLSPLIRRLAENSDVDLYPEDWLLEIFGEEKEEFQRMLRVMGASPKHGYRPIDQPMRNGWNRFLKTGDLPKALLLDSNFSESTADVIIAARAAEFAKILSVESRQLWATILYMQETARLGVAGANAAGNNCGNLSVLNDLLRVVREASAAYHVANELALSDKIRQAIELTERLEQEIFVAISQVETKRSQWLRSRHLCVECEKTLGWSERLWGSDRHTDCAAKSGRAAVETRPWWGSGKITIAVAACAILAIVAISDKRQSSPIPSPDHAPEQLVERGVCPGEGCSYGERWLAKRDVTVYLAPPNAVGTPASSLQIKTVIHKGSWVETKTITVLSTRGEGRVDLKLTTWANDVLNGPPLKDGEVIPIYTSLGEGCYTSWISGRLLHVCGPTVQREPENEGWIQIRTANGSEVWTNSASSFVSKEGLTSEIAETISDSTLSLPHKLAGINALLRKGGDLNGSVGKYGATPIYAAKAANDINLLRMLMSRGLDIRSSQSCEPGQDVAYAFQSGGDLTLDFLLQNGMRLDCMGQPPLHAFLRFGISANDYSVEQAIRVAQVLVRNGANVWQLDSNGKSIFDAMDEWGGGIEALRVAALRGALTRMDTQGPRR